MPEKKHCPKCGINCYVIINPGDDRMTGKVFGIQECNQVRISDGVVECALCGSNIYIERHSGGGL